MATTGGRRRSCDIWDWPLQHDDTVVVHNDRQRFEADLQVPVFDPNEIDIKVLDGELLLYCHQERDRGTAREVHRSYALPPDVDVKTLKSTFKNDGNLHIVASKKRHF